MAHGTLFQGFPRDAELFLSELTANNKKEWFEANKRRYEESVLGPARDFVFDMGKRLKKIAPWVVADPKVNRSLFRIHRDTRFSTDKTPYKTHLGIWLWEGKGKRMECSGFYFQLEPGQLFLATGMHVFPKTSLDRYRKAVADNGDGPALANAVAKVEKAGYPVGRRTLQTRSARVRPRAPQCTLFETQRAVDRIRDRRARRASIGGLARPLFQTLQSDAADPRVAARRDQPLAANGRGSRNPTRQSFVDATKKNARGACAPRDLREGCTGTGYAIVGHREGRATCSVGSSKGQARPLPVRSSTSRCRFLRDADSKVDARNSRRRRHRLRCHCRRHRRCRSRRHRPCLCRRHRHRHRTAPAQALGCGSQ